MKRPLVVEEERLNFDTPVKKVGANSMKCNVDVVRFVKIDSAQWLGDRKDAGDGDHLSG